ncbi:MULTISPECIES: hypothetical protein [unclassified Serratia (in: enterobacteria)]|uniref:hypothetical protein n=1 Tax=unclassified Serratia (in: enterobacteria) TaxID=2647522 RepID=UPI003075F231
MPVNILDIPPEVKITTKTPSLRLWGCILLLITIVYACIFLGFFSQYLSKNPYVFWSELLLIPLLLWGGIFSFRLLLWNGSNLEGAYWNRTRTDYYQALLQKGRVHLDVIDIKVKLPDVDGNIVDVMNHSLLPVRYTPKFTHMSRYLAFSSFVKNINDKEQYEERMQSLFNKVMPELLEDIYTHITLLPQGVALTIISVFPDSLKIQLEKLWDERFNTAFPFSSISFREGMSESLDSWLDDIQSEYFILIAVRLHGDNLINDSVDNQSESISLLFGKKSEGVEIESSPFDSLYRPEIGWDGIDKSLIWGDVSSNNQLSGVLYSGLSEKEKNDIVLKTSELMSEAALMSFNYIDTADYLCLCDPVTEILQVKYVKEFLEPGCYLFVNKSHDSLVSYFFTLAANNKGGL